MKGQGVSMFSDPLQLNGFEGESPDFGAATSTNFARLSTSKDSSAYGDTGADLSEPRELIIQHRKVGKTPNVRAQHRFALERHEIGADNIDRYSTVALSIEMPIHNDFTVAKIVNDLTELLNLFKFVPDPVDLEADHALIMAGLRGEI
jgi:hypothetical protein